MHAIFTTKPTDTPQAQEALTFWKTINKLPESGMDDLGAGVVFNFVSQSMHAKTSMLNIYAQTTTLKQLMLFDLVYAC